MDASLAFAEYIIGLKYDDIPAQAGTAVKNILLDALAVSVAGSSAPGAKDIAALVGEWGGREESTVVASKLRVPAVNAAFANGAMVRALDYNETYEVAGTHPSISVIPAAFAIAEKVGHVNGKRFLAVLAAAMDINCRMTASAKVTMSSDWLTAQLHGYLSAAAVAGALLGLSRDHMIDSFGLAYAQSAGSRQSTAEKVMARGLQGAFAAKGGVTAALLAKVGITGARDSLEGKHGLFQAYHHGNYDPAVLTKGLGKDFDTLLEISFKPYPGGRQAHQFIDAALDIIAKHDVRSGGVEAVTLFVGEQGRALCQPLEMCRNPRNITEAQHSIPYAVATAIVKRGVVLDDFIGEGFRDPTVLLMARKITPRFEPRLVRKAIEPGSVEVQMRNGKKYRADVEFARGTRERPFSVADHAAKFKDCATWAARPLPTGNTDKIIKVVNDLEKVEDVGEIMTLLAGN